MPSVSELMKDLGCVPSGSNFYYPNTHPHVHIGVSNGSKVVNNLQEVRAEIQFIALSWGGGGTVRPAINLYNRTGGAEAFENKRWNLHKKTRFETALHDSIGIADAMAIQKIVNLSTGIGLDL